MSINRVDHRPPVGHVVETCSAAIELFSSISVFWLNIKFGIYCRMQTEINNDQSGCWSRLSAIYWIGFIIWTRDPWTAIDQSESVPDFPNFVGTGPVWDLEFFLGFSPVRSQVLKFFVALVWTENGRRFGDYASLNLANLWHQKLNKVTSMLVTDVRDEIWWWQV